MLQLVRRESDFDCPLQTHPLQENVVSGGVCKVINCRSAGQMITVKE